MPGHLTPNNGPIEQLTNASCTSLNLRPLATHVGSACAGVKYDEDYASIDEAAQDAAYSSGFDYSYTERPTIPDDVPQLPWEPACPMVEVKNGSVVFSMPTLSVGTHVFSIYATAIAPGVLPAATGCISLPQAFIHFCSVRALVLCCHCGHRSRQRNTPTGRTVWASAGHDRFVCTLRQSAQLQAHTHCRQQLLQQMALQAHTEPLPAVPSSSAPARNVLAWNWLQATRAALQAGRGRADDCSNADSCDVLTSERDCFQALGIAGAPALMCHSTCATALTACATDD